MSKCIVITAEHAGKHVPLKYQHLFDNNQIILDTHRGYDFGTNTLFDTLINELNPVYFSKHLETRLLIDYNRSLHHKNVYNAGLYQENKLELTNQYQAYRSNLINAIATRIDQGDIVYHIALHSFTPELKGEVRNCDLSFLYDPKRVVEVEFVNRAFSSLKHNWITRRNYPYRGVADGLTTALRKVFLHNYAGIELEINQKWVDNNRFPEKMIQDLIEVLR